ncbi:MAG: hypothetical protein Q8O13_00745 [Candidatus Omnitrophota bacterium]|nr:hypothetical protein [Candidatus Omnitrophota bacterium]
MPPEIKHSIKGDIKEFFLILNCSYITVVSLVSLLMENKTVTATAFAFCFINCLASFIFYRLRLMRYQRSESLKGQS